MGVSAGAPAQGWSAYTSGAFYNMIEEGMDVAIRIAHIETRRCHGKWLRDTLLDECVKFHSRRDFDNSTEDVSGHAVFPYLAGLMSESSSGTGARWSSGFSLPSFGASLHAEAWTPAAWTSTSLNRSSPRSWQRVRASLLACSENRQ